GLRLVRIRVAERGQIRRARPRAELAEQRVVQRTLLETAYRARRIVEVAEHDRLGGTGRRARGHHLTVADPSALLLGVDARGIDPLHAVRALLHHAAASHGDVGISL